ncbi:MAG: FAD-dependent monooxygenase [Pseudorhodoplanes sp.]
MAASRTLIVAGAGIGGLTTALTLAHHGFRVLVIEQNDLPQETGAGIQLAPNAMRILRKIGVEDRLRDRAVIPQALSIMNGRGGREIVRLSLGEASAFRYGAPYWLVHRADLQSALLDAARANPDIELRFGERVDDFADHAYGLTVQVTRNSTLREERALALVGADGLWSRLRRRFGDRTTPRFSHRAAWRALMPVEKAPEEFRSSLIRLWLGPQAHIVHYPVRAGALINLVAIAPDERAETTWGAPASRDEVLKRFADSDWCSAAREILVRPERWQRWSLYDRPASRLVGEGPATLVGDAAHPMPPFLAQGAAMAIEDAAILAQCLGEQPDAIEQAMRRYENLRHPRIAAVRRAVHRADRIYHLTGFMAAARNAAMRGLGGERLRMRYDWLYDWPAG